MQEQLISFETAKLAKEKGFNTSTLSYYFEDGEFRENKLTGTNGYYGEEYSFEYEEFLENWNDKFRTTKEGDRCYGCTQTRYLETYSAPTQSLLQKWLREVHSIDITVFICMNTTYEVTVHKDRQSACEPMWVKVTHENHKILYETALERGLMKGLQLI